MDYAPTLEQAAGSDDKIGALQMLLAHDQAPVDPRQVQNPSINNELQQRIARLALSRVGTPEQAQQLSQQRQSGLEAYQAALLSPPNGTFTPTEMGAYTWVGNMGRTTPWTALTSGIAAGGKALAENQAGMQKGAVEAAKAGYDDAANREKLEISELAVLKNLASSGKYGNISGEKIAPLIRTAWNRASDEARDPNNAKNFKSDQEARDWIDARATAISRQMLDLLAEEGRMPQYTSTPTGAKQTPGTASPGVDAAQTPTGQGGSLPPPNQKTSVTASEPDQIINLPGDMDPTRAKVVIDEFNRNVKEAKNPTSPESRERALRNMQILREKYGVNLPADPVKTPSVATNDKKIPNVDLIDPVAQKGQISAEQSWGKLGPEVFQKAYDEVQAKQDPAIKLLSAANALEKVAPKTDKLAEAKSEWGQWLSAMGQNPNDPVIQDAFKTRDANLIINQLRNALLRAEKGVQTVSDEKRIANELMKTTDANEIWRYGISLMKERALRDHDQMSFFNDARQRRDVNASTKWNQQIADDPYTQEIGGKLFFRDRYLRKYAEKYPEETPEKTREKAVESWKSLERDWKKRNAGK